LKQDLVKQDSTERYCEFCWTSIREECLLLYQLALDAINFI
jgi:hypothetical protein